jgi:epoxyqueuosine reductase
LVEKVRIGLEACGYQGRVVPKAHLADLRSEIASQRAQGLLDAQFHQKRLGAFRFDPPSSLSQACSVIVVAVRQPQIRFTFTWRGHLIALMVPPTYLHWRRTDQAVAATLREILEPEGFRLADALLPKKALAVRSGLAAYGRNNITYVPGMGSFHRLVVFWSDLPSEAGEWGEAQMMARCENCAACVRSCPTGAIGTERFLLRAERCIAYLNEEPSSVAFPAWMNPAWHECIVGCLLCQKVCPENAGGLSWIEEGAAFTAEETAALLAGTALEALPPATAEKLRESDMIELLDVLPRNLTALLSQAERCSPQ